MESILITGSNGFLGLNLANSLIQKNYDVFGISHGDSKNPAIKQIHNDIKSVKDAPNTLSSILHFAALTDIQYCQDHPKQCIDTNVIGTQNMLEIARKNDSKFIFASTSHVYGNPVLLPITEDAPLNPNSIHATSKVCGELLCETYANSYGLDVIIVRLFSIYGPGSPSYSIIFRIISQILYNEKIILGNVESKRDFLHISDFVSAIELLLNSNIKGCSKFNLGYGKGISIGDLCTKLIKISGKNMLMECDEKLLRNNDIKELVCNNSKLKQLGWTPKVILDEGLIQVFQWFKLNYGTDVIV